MKIKLFTQAFYIQQQTNKYMKNYLNKYMI